MGEARYLKAEEAAAYLSLGRTTFAQLVARGALPAPLTIGDRVKRWDRIAIDKAVARGAGDTIPSPDADEAVERMLNDWEERAAQRRARRQKASR